VTRTTATVPAPTLLSQFAAVDRTEPDASTIASSVTSPRKTRISYQPQ
jgi:hypothetical protein